MKPKIKKRTHLKIRFHRRDTGFLKRGEGADAESYQRYDEAETRAAAKNPVSEPKWNVEMGSSQTWRHPGGKLRERGADTLSDVELLAILISVGIAGKSAEQIAEELLVKYGSFRGLANQPLTALIAMKGLGDVKVIRIAAAFEIARRIADKLFQEHAEKE